MLVVISSGMKDAVNMYGFRFVPHIKIIKTTYECQRGCGERQQNYKGQIHNSNCRWEKKELTIFSDFVEKDEVLQVLSNYAT